ncbi:trichohyalin-like [Symsagittifera roscoffensis]|uniref:trichohyalin-like n=1 Tax=Symsagittifera roscoffensis TaxID=84072 RepID=UPI00307C6D06
MDVDDEDELRLHLHKNIKSNFGRKPGEPKLGGDEIGLWSKYYHSSYGHAPSNGNPYYRDVYARDASDFSRRQRGVLGEMRDMKDILSKDRTKLLDYTAILEDQHDSLYRMSRDPYYEFLLLKHPQYRDKQSYFPRRKEVNERLSKLDRFYGDKLRWAEENGREQKNREWLQAYLTQREKDREKPKQTLNHLQQYLEHTGEANRRIGQDLEEDRERRRQLDDILAHQNSSIRKLEKRLANESEERSRKAANLRRLFEEEADQISEQIARQNMLRHSLLPATRLPLPVSPRTPPFLAHHPHSRHSLLLDD